MLFGEYIRLMALVEYSAEEIKTVFSDYPDLEVCVYAAPTQTVIGGPPEQVDAIIERAEKEGKFARKFQTKGASHTQQMDPLLGELAAELQGIEPRPLTTGYFSTVHEGSYIRPGGEPIHDVDYWKKGLRHSVYFTHGIRNAVDNGHTTFLELAPNPGCAHAGWPDDGGRRAARRAADRDAGPQAGRGRLDDRRDGAAVRATATTWTSARCSSRRSRRGRLRQHSADPVPAQAALAGGAASPVTARRMMPGNHVAMPDGRHVWEYVPKGGDRPRRTGESRCGTGASGCQADGVRAACGARRRCPAGDDADPPPRRRERAGARPHRRVVHAGLRRDRQPRRHKPPRCRRPWPPERPWPSTVSAAPVVEPRSDDAEILTDHLTQGANLGAGFAKWSPDSGETVQRPAGRDRRRRDGLRARGPSVGGAADRAGPGLADGGADQEPRRVRLRPAADSVDRRCATPTCTTSRSSSSTRSSTATRSRNCTSTRRRRRRRRSPPSRPR